jgi:threonine synthase
MSLKSLKCKECGTAYELDASYFCENCFGPLEAVYDHSGLDAAEAKRRIQAGSQGIWRYADFLPFGGRPGDPLEPGLTPLLRADRLAERLGLDAELYVKNDAANPTHSFKDRVVAVAVAKARELGFDTVACASTGNLANSVAAHAAAAGLPAYIFIPRSLEASKIIGTQVYGARVVAIDGTYDQVNRLCAEIGGKYPWAFANINMRAYYAEGSKTYAYEIAEQLGWRTPDHIVVPMAGGSLVCKVAKAWRELAKLGWIEEPATRIHGAQGAGCAPIVEAVLAGRDTIIPVKEPRTIARSLAIGNPADGYYAIQTITGSGGTGVAATDEEIVAAIRLLAETEGIFTETAGGVTLAAAIRLIRDGRIGTGESVVVSITGQGLKTTEPLVAALAKPPVIGPNLSEVDKLLSAPEA